jgi:hypothetical protein
MIKKMSLKISFWVLLMALLAISSFAIVEKLSLEKMTQKAQRIILGTVTHTESRWEKLGTGKRIFTYVYIDVEKDIKGAGTRLVEIKVPGGKVGEITEVVSDTPQFTPGEKAVLFLRNEYFQVVGWYQGKFSIRDDVVVGPGVRVNDFVNKIQQIDRETKLGPGVFPATQIMYSGEISKSRSGPSFGTPAQARLNMSSSRPGFLQKKRQKKSPDQSVSNADFKAQAGWTTIMTEGFEGSFPSGAWNVYGDPTWG